MEKSYYKLIFLTDQGEESIITVSNAKQVPDLVAKGAMANIILGNAFLTSKGRLVSSKSCKFYNTTSNEYQLV